MVTSLKGKPQRALLQNSLRGLTSSKVNIIGVILKMQWWYCLSQSSRYLQAWKGIENLNRSLRLYPKSNLTKKDIYLNPMMRPNMLTKTNTLRCKTSCHAHSGELQHLQAPSPQQHHYWGFPTVWPQALGQTIDSGSNEHAHRPNPHNTLAGRYWLP